MCEIYDNSQPFASPVLVTSGRAVSGAQSATGRRGDFDNGISEYGGAGRRAVGASLNDREEGSVGESAD